MQRSIFQDDFRNPALAGDFKRKQKIACIIDRVVQLLEADHFPRGPLNQHEIALLRRLKGIPLAARLKENRQLAGFRIIEDFNLFAHTGIPAAYYLSLTNMDYNSGNSVFSPNPSRCRNRGFLS